MDERDTVYIHAEGDRQIFGIEIQHFAGMTVLGGGHAYDADLLTRQIDWLTCAINAGDERATLDLRIVSVPCPEFSTRGRIRVALLCGIDGCTADEAQKRSREFFQLCRAHFDEEYAFAPVLQEQELFSLLRPFPIGAMVEIERRAERVALDTLQTGASRKTMGFATDAANAIVRPGRPQPSIPDGGIFHIYPYLPNSGRMGRLFHLLLMQDEPAAIAFRLRPTALRPGEAQFIEQQIYQCERYAQISVGSVGKNIETVRPTLQEHARAFQRQLTRSLYALKDNAAMLRVYVAAPARVPQMVADVLGAQITQPAGKPGRDGDFQPFLSGGYEITNLIGDPLERAAAAWGTLAMPAEEAVLEPRSGRLRCLFDSAEAAAVFRLPVPELKDIPGVTLRHFRTSPPPSTLPESGHHIGSSLHDGRSHPVRLSTGDRRRHVYAVGQTGTGKTTMFESMILNGIREGEGVCVMDPHGDLIEKLLGRIPPARKDDVVILDPGDLAYPVGLNLLEYESEAEKYFLVQELVAIVERLLQQTDPTAGGPMFYQYVRMGLLLVMSDPKRPGTLPQFHQLFNSRDYYQRFLPLKSHDPILENFVEQTLDRADFTRQSRDGSGTWGSYISSKFESFVSDPMLRNIFGQARSTIDLREIMDTGKILLVNLSKGRLGEVNSRFFGMVLIAKLQAAAMARATVPIEKRRDFYLYVDEFQNLATLNFGTLLSEGRKYRLNLILTNQYVTQIDPRIANAISGNVGTVIAFRVGPQDAEYLEREFGPTFSRYDLMNLPMFHTCISTLIGGQVTKPFSMQVASDKTPFDKVINTAIRQHSREKYGRPRNEVEAVIAQSLESQASLTARGRKNL